MLKGQEGNILPCVITCCSSNALVEWGTQGGFGQSSPSQNWHEAIHVPPPKPSPYLIETHRHKGHSLPGR